MYKSICGKFLLCLKGKYNGSQISRNIKSIEYAFISFGLPCGQLVKNLPAMGGPGFNLWVGRIPWKREQLPIPIFWPGEFHGEFHGQRSLAGYSPWSWKSQTQLSDFHFTSLLFTSSSSTFCSLYGKNKCFENSNPNEPELDSMIIKAP